MSLVSIVSLFMGDPRLNSLHLDPGRRENYRQAREVLLQSRGNETVYVERKQKDDSSIGNTFIQNKTGVVAPHLDCWLFDRDFIYPLKVGLNTMGRSGDNDVIVEDLYVSRRHAAILVHHDKTYVLHDTASKNGTYLNGVKIGGPTTLNPGDEIRICNRQFVFLTRNSPDAVAPLNPTCTLGG